MVVFFNPLSTTRGKQSMPLSVLSLAAAIDDREPWALVDGNVTHDPVRDIVDVLSPLPASAPAVLAVTAMPGPQLAQALAVTRAVRGVLPHVRVVWGGYFPTQHPDVVLRSELVDAVVRGQGEGPFAALIDAWRAGRTSAGIPGVSWREADRMSVNADAAPVAPDDLPDLPYHRIDMEPYLRATYLGRRTAAHHSSFGCPFACSFCAVVAMSNRRWLAQSPGRVARVAEHLVRHFGVDSLQMFDMDFFVSETRAREIAERLVPLNLGWWALGRVDTLLTYEDRTWRRLTQSGLRMVFSGAESGSSEALSDMNKGGQADAGQALELARRVREYGIVPEFSFVLGAPPDPHRDLEVTFEYIRAIKRVNPATEIILYAYTPVPSRSAMSAQADASGFAYPETLEAWASPEWQRVSLRRGVGLPWMDAGLRRRIRNFERVLNAYYPTVTDARLTGLRRAVLRAASGWRYRLGVYGAPVELRALHRVMAYQRPETTGF